jgi:Ca2+-transporting ATPase|tara:strand:- start:731 stop:973 length:243 start_codon:yes stop_codon:yes gene_type:complete
MTVNITVITITFIGGATLGHTPLNVIQMIWINLIMDILAAIALGTETFKRDDDVSVKNKSNRISRKDKILLPEMWRQIFI